MAHNKPAWKMAHNKPAWKRHMSIMPAKEGQMSIMPSKKFDLLNITEKSQFKLQKLTF